MTFNLYSYSSVNPGKRKTEKRINTTWKACFFSHDKHWRRITAGLRPFLRSLTTVIKPNDTVHMRFLCRNKVHSLDSVGRPEASLFTLKHRLQYRSRPGFSSCCWMRGVTTLKSITLKCESAKIRLEISIVQLIREIDISARLFGSH